ncbi:MAG: UDP-N-acetylmuramoyl-tripeptide--D-alanyl-D-alanine ligase [Acidobacteria bacterium]|nr:UDP-N-acetylmuramoyl-tripeptide--D-alanyl-D-alanine ligase [Acidobacteriota bacterium]NIM60256.1 UDP-N-acetylmuramoyl-tripeptide--D-alanyl-D-alanine ligase [Acidobacteriota bacterium]NIO60294.1 UDP-N-acetylmuramoyl-tripeptide--D-alanyl-D-alanine ligase [Acidobacteriota bacterium]NIQ31349.1 UDP-N-acetylmuramoyl-tripeptide--D-alanyl-D-alanine ligase [Acidobacteriota bacterium]NIQ86572.1 UDP-N-acetylmuramoyl-tripeptide--D-alanyl-D-alanine ligase [Acidobacteriota bacterium]
MPELTASELAQACHGQIVRGDETTRVASYGIDSRRLEQRSAFFAVTSERSDGHRFLGEAREAGALVGIVQHVPDLENAPGVLIQVEDTVAALADCARAMRKRYSGATWIAITGSNGKTTTKEMVAAGLSAGFAVYRTPGNFNNHLGVPLTLLACPDDVEMIVLEIAMSTAGEIAHLTELVDPDIGLVTNVRAAHLENFSSIEDIAAAKGELFALMRDDAIAVVNRDDAHVRVQATRHVGPQVTFGHDVGTDLRIEALDNRFVPGAGLTVNHDGRSFRLQLRIGGGHAALNALAALATVAAAGGDLEGAARKIELLEPDKGRGQVHDLRRNIQVVDDCYNASPSAMASVLETLRQSDPRGRRVLIMGDMLELGQLGPALHREVGKRCGAAGIGMLVTIGKLSRGAAEAARRAGVPEVHHHPDVDKATESIVEFLSDGDLIVVKGSRSMHLERVVHRLTEELAPHPPQNDPTPVNHEVGR